MSPVSGAGSAMSVQQIIDLRNQIINRSDALQGIHAPEAAAAGT